MWYSFLGVVQFTIWEAIFLHCCATNRIPFLSDEQAFHSRFHGPFQTEYQEVLNRHVRSLALRKASTFLPLTGSPKQAFQTLNCMFYNLPLQTYKIAPPTPTEYTKDGSRLDNSMTPSILFPSGFSYVKKGKRFVILYSNRKFSICNLSCFLT